VRKLSLLLLSFILAGSARAESIDFGYSWTVLPGPVFVGGTGSVALTPAANGTSSAELGSTAGASIAGADISTSSSAVDTPDVYAATFGLKLTLTDTLSGGSGDVTFGGSLAGSLTFDSSSLKATFDGDLVKTLTLGGHVYSVSLPGEVTAPAPGSSAIGWITAQVTVADEVVNNPPPGPVDAPEPGSLILAATAAAAGLARWRVARRPTAA
jgi:hypothetical protein